WKSYAPRRAPASFYSSYLICGPSKVSSLVLRLGKRLLKPINQFLHVFLPQRLEQTSGQRNHPTQHARLPRPFHFRLPARQLFELKPRANRRRASRHLAFPFVRRLPRLLLVDQGHLYRGRPANMRNAHAQFHQKILWSHNLHALKIRQQPTKALLVHQEPVDFFRRFLHRELAGEFTVQKTPEEVYGFLVDPKRFCPLLPD